MRTQRKVDHIIMEEGTHGQTDTRASTRPAWFLVSGFYLLVPLFFNQYVAHSFHFHCSVGVRKLVLIEKRGETKAAQRKNEPFFVDQIKIVVKMLWSLSHSLSLCLLLLFPFRTYTPTHIFKQVFLRRRVETPCINLNSWFHMEVPFSNLNIYALLDIWLCSFSRWATGQKKE